MQKPSLRHRIRAARTQLPVSVFDRAVHAAARLRFKLPDALPARFHVAVEKDIPYRATGDLAHTLDAYIPTRAPKPLPTILYVHGGGFAMLSKETHRVMALAYARRGYLVFCINYRLGPKHRFPAPLEDACAALEWARDNAAAYGGDPNNLAIAGESAGGNLVTAVTVAACMRRPEPFAERLFEADVRLRATVATYGFLDLDGIDHYERHPKLPRHLKDMVFHAAASYVGLDVRAGCAAAPLASPLLVLERARELDRPLPPFFADAGTRDPLLGDSRRLKAAVESLGGRCTLHIAPGEIHGYDALMWRPAAREKWQRMHDFLAPNMQREPERFQSGVVLGSYAGDERDERDERDEMDEAGDPGDGGSLPEIAREAKTGT